MCEVQWCTSISLITIPTNASCSRRERSCYDLSPIQAKNIYVFWYVISCSLVVSYLPMFNTEDSILTIEAASPSETLATSYPATCVTSQNTVVLYSHNSANIKSYFHFKKNHFSKMCVCWTDCL
jgi:hypothetical protein